MEIFKYRDLSNEYQGQITILKSNNEILKRERDNAVKDSIIAIHELNKLRRIVFKQQEAIKKYEETK